MFCFYQVILYSPFVDCDFIYLYFDAVVLFCTGILIPDQFVSAFKRMTLVVPGDFFTKSLLQDYYLIKKTTIQ